VIILHHVQEALKAKLSSFFRSISAPEIFLIVTLLVFGSVACLAIPISAGYDEETHFVRAWEMAHLYLIPNEQLGAKLPFPAIYWELSYRRQAMVEAVPPGLWNQYGGLRMDAHDYVYSNVVTRSVYSPLLLLPQAFILRYLGLSLDLPALFVYYACRFAGLLSYLVLCWVGLRALPVGKWLLAVLMVSPMALFQASSISADTISNGIGFLFLGASLWLAEKQQIRWKQWLLLLGVIALLFMAKVNLLFLVLLPFLLIRPSRYAMKWGYYSLAAAAVVLFAVEVAGWNLVAYSHFTRMLEGASPAGQVRYILSAPLNFIAIIVRDLWTNGPSYVQGWIGVYGYNYWPVPALTYILYPLAVVAALMVSARDASAGQAGTALISRRETPLVLVALFVVGVLLTIVSLYVAFTPVGTQGVAGVQGRYFTPVMPLLLLGLVSWRSTPAILDRIFGLHRSHAILRWTTGLALAALVLYTGGMILSYHVPCGSEYYQPGLCYQPVYKNWAPDAASSPAVGPAMTITQEIVPACNDMQELDVWVNSPGSDASGTTRFTLHSTQSGADIVDKTIRNADVPEYGWVKLGFAPQPNSQNQLYVLTVGSPSSDGIRLGYSLKADYTDGKLYQNGAPVSQDVLFQYGCRAGLAQWLSH
jgi:uncharacterized membrane protein